MKLQRETPITCVDIKGIGKPSTFASDPKQINSWSLKLGNFLEGIAAGMKESPEWAQEQEKDIK